MTLDLMWARNLHPEPIKEKQRVPVEEQVEQPGTGGNRKRPLWLDQAGDQVQGLLRRESVGLVAGDRAEGLAVLNELGRISGAAPVSLTEVGLPGTPVRRWEEFAERLAGCPLLYDLESLCWDRGLGLDVLRLLRLHARKQGVVALWPGRINERIATFSAPGRRDFVRFALGELSVLRPVSTRFPDEVPFEIERIP